MTLHNMKTTAKVCGAVFIATMISIWIRYSIPWWQALIPLLSFVGLIWIIRVYSLSDGMLHTALNTKFNKKLKQTLIDNIERYINKED